MENDKGQVVDLYVCTADTPTASKTRDFGYGQ